MIAHPSRCFGKGFSYWTTCREAFSEANPSNISPSSRVVVFSKAFLGGINGRHQTAAFFMVYSDVDFSDASAAVVLI